MHQFKSRMCGKIIQDLMAGSSPTAIAKVIRILALHQDEVLQRGKYLVCSFAADTGLFQIVSLCPRILFICLGLPSVELVYADTKVTQHSFIEWGRYWNFRNFRKSIVIHGNRRLRFRYRTRIRKRRSYGIGYFRGLLGVQSLPEEAVCRRSSNSRKHTHRVVTLVTTA